VEFDFFFILYVGLSLGKPKNNRADFILVLVISQKYWKQDTNTGYILTISKYSNPILFMAKILLLFRKQATSNS
jgi:hypothetical protein